MARGDFIPDSYRIIAPTLALAGTVRPNDFLGVNVNSVGVNVGTLTLNGQVSLMSSTSLVFDLASTAASDQLQVNGALTLNGTLTVNALASAQAATT